MQSENFSKYLTTALREAKKSVMNHTHGCVAVDIKTGQILARAFNDWSSWNDNEYPSSSAGRDRFGQPWQKASLVPCGNSILLSSA
jgi:cell division protein FtsI/penicillin-binding protein 2